MVMLGVFFPKKRDHRPFSMYLIPGNEQCLNNWDSGDEQTLLQLTASKTQGCH